MHTKKGNPTGKNGRAGYKNLGKINRQKKKCWLNRISKSRNKEIRKKERKERRRKERKGRTEGRRKGRKK